MRKVLLLLLAVCVLPSTALAQGADCPGCELGIYNATDLAENFGTFAAGTKDIYIAVKFAGGFAGLTGAEFSVRGLEPFFTNFQPNGANVTLGDIKAPADTLTGTGGINMAWSTCQTAVNGGFVVGTLTLIAIAPVGNDVVFSVLRKFPPDAFGKTHFNQCNPPFFTQTSVRRGCYVINPTGQPGDTIGGCTLKGTAVENSQWSAVKTLYR